MSKLGRNDPCWCGSEKKYKRCHWPHARPMSMQGAQLGQGPKIEIAKAIKAIRDADLLDRTNLEELKGKMADKGHHEAIDRAVAGLSEEDEFALICRNMGTVTHLSRLDQTPLIPGTAIPPDFLARFRPGFPERNIPADEAKELLCFVEVKSTQKSEFTMRAGELRRRLEYADSMGLRLLIAVRFLMFGRNSLWAFADASEHERGKLRVDPGDFGSGLRTVLWDDYIVSLPPGTFVEHVYDKSRIGDGPERADLGALVAVRVRNSSVSVPIDELHCVLYSVLLGAFDLQEVDRTTEGTVTRVASAPRLPLGNATLPDLVMALHRGFGLEPGQVLVSESKRDLPVLDRHFVLSLLRPLASVNLVVSFGLGDPEMLFEIWKKYFGDEPSP